MPRDCLFIVVRHTQSPEQPYANSWEDNARSTRLNTIMTTPAVARALRGADAAGVPILVHRCAWSGGHARIVCEVTVQSVVDLGGSAMAVFDVTEELDEPPPRPGAQGENFYWS